MDREICEIIHSTSALQLVSTRSDRAPAHLSFTEDDQVTRRLSSSRSAGSRSEEISGSKNESDLDHLRAGDEIVIKTAHSIYRFTVVDPTIPSGRLLGGVLGDRPVEAALISARERTERSETACTKIGAGSKAIFLVEWGNSLRQLTTSTITRLTHRRCRFAGNILGSPRCVTIEHVASGQSDQQT